MVERGLASTRTKAQALILAGQVKVRGEQVRKVGLTLPVDANIQLIAGPPFVSRGGEKLEGALEDFKLIPDNKVCLDVGSSTGGFTDCLLQKGARLVYSIDVGRRQLADSLRNDYRVRSMEEIHILEVKPELLNPQPNFCVIDVSFISLKKILGHIKSLMGAGSPVLAMVKPQFEVGAKFLKKGVVREVEVQKRAVDDVIQFAKAEGFYYFDQSPARLKGPKGNQEYFVFLKTP